jgi:hypothetical protein
MSFVSRRFSSYEIELLWACAWLNKPDIMRDKQKNATRFLQTNLVFRI